PPGRSCEPLVTQAAHADAELGPVAAHSRDDSAVIHVPSRIGRALGRGHRDRQEEEIVECEIREALLELFRRETRLQHCRRQGLCEKAWNRERSVLYFISLLEV